MTSALDRERGHRHEVEEERGVRRAQTHHARVPRKATRSHHFRVLREAGVTQTRVAGTHRHISLRRDDLEARFPGLLGAVLSGSERGALDVAAE